MIKTLSIRNYALIDHLQTEFHPGLTAITGETGSGKSILLGALGLALGERADHGALHTHESKCIVEILVDCHAGLLPFFEANDLDYAPATIIRREITPAGKSRSFINDTPVQLGITRQLGSRLVDIHSQHATGLLSDSAYQLEVVDGVADHTALLTSFGTAFKTWKAAHKKLTDFREQLANWSKEVEFNRFQLRELEGLPLDGLHLETLEQEVAQMERADDIREALAAALGALQGDRGAEGQLDTAKTALDRIRDISDSFASLADRLESVRIELNDVSEELEHSSAQTEVDPSLLEQNRGQLNTLISLLQKHTVADVEALRTKRNALREALDDNNDASSSETALAQEVSDAREKLDAIGQKLTKSRMKAASKLEKELAGGLEQLGLERAKLSVEFEQTETPTSTGSDKITFAFCANPGSPSLPLAKVASGGEISRVMLAVKTCLAKHRNLPCLIFDEIDTGIGGEMARRMGLVLRELSGHAQVISITHQPAIAGLAHSQFKVHKSHEGELTRTGLRSLDQEARIREIAEMIAGSEAGESAMASARELLNP